MNRNCAATIHCTSFSSRVLPSVSVQIHVSDRTNDLVVGRFREALRFPIDSFSYTSAFESAQLNIITSENSFDIALSGNIAKVSSALHPIKKSLFVGAGSRIIQDQSWGRPDWVAGDSMIRYADRLDICQGILCGDSKMSWNAHEVSNFVNNKREHYEKLPSRRNDVSPYEQAQRYCQQWSTRYGFFITEKYLVVICLKLSPSDPNQGLSRQIRETQASGYKRISSDFSTMADISETFSAMSFEPPSDDHDIGGLGVAIIPWDHGKRQVLTVNLALFFLVLLGQDERYFFCQHDSLGKSEKRRIPATPAQSGKRRRESESQGKASQTIQKSPYPELFVPCDSIHKDVILADIGVYIPGATARAAEHQERHGFKISQSKEAKFAEDELILMISDLQADTANWKNEGEKYKESKYISLGTIMEDPTNDPDRHSI